MFEFGQYKNVIRRSSIGIVIPIASILLSGCGGSDLGGGSRNNNFDQGLQGNYSGYGNNGAGSRGLQAGAKGRGVYPHVEASFELGDVRGNPFDYFDVDVQVTLQTPDNKTIRIPAFYDGNKMWRARFSPEMTGRVTVQKVQLNGRDIQPTKFEKRELEANGTALPGFVRLDQKDKTRFAFDNGNSFYPLGNNVPESLLPASSVSKQTLTSIGTKPEEKSAVKPADPKAVPEKSAPKPEEQPAAVSTVFDRMSRGGANFARFGIGNLEPQSTGKLGEFSIDIDAAKRLDNTLDSAEKAGIYCQLVLESYKNFSTRVDPAWDKNRLNSKVGGILSTADEYFSNPRAAGRMRAMLRYVAARWGYSTRISSFELFDEAENTDSAFHKHGDEISAWHNAMASFLRQQDMNKHLITSSSGIDPALLGRELDFYQIHSRVATAKDFVSEVDARKLDRPVFVGSIGGVSGDDSSALMRHALWSSVVNESAGAPVFADGSGIDKSDLYGRYREVSEFQKQSGLMSKRGLLTIQASVESDARVPLTVRPGAGWAVAKQLEFNVLPNGNVPGISTMPAFLQGSGTKSMFPSATFKANYPEAGTFTAEFDGADQSGAHVVVTIDGVQVGEKDIAGKSAGVTKLEAKVPAGSHSVKLENTGNGWSRIRNLTFSNLAPSIGVVGKGSKDFAAFWIFHRNTPKTAAAAKLNVPGLQAGIYRVTWWDSEAGKSLKEADAEATTTGLSLESLAFSSDVAVWVARGNQAKAKFAKEGKVGK